VRPPLYHPHTPESNDCLAALRASSFLSDDVLRAMVREGVDLAALARRWQAGLLDIPRLSRVAYRGLSGFEFRDAADVNALLFAVRDEIGDAIDLAAWSPPRPPALWCGRGALLGGENLFAPRMREALAVYKTPLGWLRGQGCGVVVLDKRKAAPLLRRAEPLQARSIEHGIELRRMLTQRPPCILIPAAPIERIAA
jgi:hypothetical protein